MIGTFVDKLNKLLSTNATPSNTAIRISKKEKTDIIHDIVLTRFIEEPRLVCRKDLKNRLAVPNSKEVLIIPIGTQNGTTQLNLFSTSTN